MYPPSTPIPEIMSFIRQFRFYQANGRVPIRNEEGLIYFFQDVRALQPSEAIYDAFCFYSIASFAIPSPFTGRINSFDEEALIARLNYCVDEDYRLNRRAEFMC